MKNLITNEQVISLAFGDGEYLTAAQTEGIEGTGSGHVFEHTAVDIAAAAFAEVEETLEFAIGFSAGNDL